ncbi:hypothetical protein BDK88_4048 [Natrinema hispanicum]|uniref:Uncharacterized protein n=1 Tax=Natrinema hispanicum TaxID=392421 RepID=A0A482Y3L0_9EURY|nr:hypothetical protein BDK88_4048 [Natrinema hispanicum]
MSAALDASGYSIDDPRTRRALNEKLDVRFATVGPIYEVESESGGYLRGRYRGNNVYLS